MTCNKDLLFIQSLVCSADFSVDLWVQLLLRCSFVAAAWQSTNCRCVCVDRKIYVFIISKNRQEIGFVLRLSNKKKSMHLFMEIQLEQSAGGRRSFCSNNECTRDVQLNAVEVFLTFSKSVTTTTTFRTLSLYQPWASYCKLLMSYT